MIKTITNSSTMDHKIMYYKYTVGEKPTMYYCRATKITDDDKNRWEVEKFYVNDDYPYFHEITYKVKKPGVYGKEIIIDKKKYDSMRRKWKRNDRKIKEKIEHRSKISEDDEREQFSKIIKRKLKVIIAQFNKD